MVVLRIKEYSDGKVCLEYRITRKEKGMIISDREVSLSSYHYCRIGTFGEKSGFLENSGGLEDNGTNIDLIEALSRVGESRAVDFTIELAVINNEYLDTRIRSVIRLFCLVPEDVLLVIPNS